MTNQEAFDVMARHLLTQRARSTVGLECRYRGPNGTKCAVGALIPDGEYSLEMEGASVDEIVCPSLSGLDVAMLKRIQAVHDAHSPKDWPERLRVAAARFALSEAVIDEMESKEV